MGESEMMRRLTALLLAASLPFTVAAQDPASEATRAAQDELAKRLPLDDPRDEANATRGKIAEIPVGLIQAADGRIIWDRRPYAFLNAKEAPDTVNQSLWRQARPRSEEHTSEHQSLMPNSYAVFCLKK